ncbi:MAG: sigma-70 family RNA polymerase sigma factor [Polyangiaceae bacterium]|nr:sigma-70 family RNA polymerase sigma factor [Polyangiaceae bacterium]
MQDLDSLLPAIVAGDTEAFGRFMAAVELPVRRSLRPFATRADTEAIVQEAFLRVWQVAPKLKLDEREHGLYRFVLRVARNLALDAVKGPRGAAKTDLDHAPEPAEPPVEVDPLLRRRIAECFERLPTQPGNALRARLDNDGADPDTMLAERCGMKPNTFLQNVTRAKKLMEDCLERKGVPLPRGPVRESAAR